MRFDCSRVAPRVPADGATLIVAAGIDILATARLTRLLVSDVIATRPRMAVLDRWPAGTSSRPSWSWVLTCERCAAVWVALGVGAVRGRRPWRAVDLLWTLAVAEAAAVIAMRD